MRSFFSRPSATHLRPFWQWWPVLCCGARSTSFRLDDHAGAGGRRRTAKEQDTWAAPHVLVHFMTMPRVAWRPQSRTVWRHTRANKKVACSWLDGRLRVCMCDSVFQYTMQLQQSSWFYDSFHVAFFGGRQVVSTYSPNHCLIDQVMETDLGKLLRCFCFGQASLRNQNWEISVNKSALHKFPCDPCFETSAWICCLLQSLFSGICATKNASR